MNPPRHGLSDATLLRITETLARFPAVERAVLFGSRAKGTHKLGSDIDLALYGETLDWRTVGRLLDYHKPAAFVLENVKNLKSHDKGRTFQIIYDTLTRALGYQVHYKVIDARHVVPQHRERVFLVGFREPRYFEFPAFPKTEPRLGSILEREVPAKYTLTDNLWAYLQAYAKKHQDAGNGFGFGLVTAGDTTRTLSARYDTSTGVRLLTVDDFLAKAKSFTNSQAA